jgi:hypothetical protein
VTFSTDQSLLYKHSLVLKKPPYTIYNSTLTFDPEFAIWNKSSDQQVAVNVSPGGESINAAQIDITYDPAKARVENLITENSLCAQNMFLEKSIDNQRGEVRVSCLLPSPGFSGRIGNVVTLALRSIQDGDLALHFATDTEVLANDGLGTNVLRLAIDGNYHIVDESAAKNGLHSIVVFSPSYPDAAQWYSKSNGLFMWVASSSLHYLYALNQTPVMSSLAGASSTISDSVSFPKLTDGIYYFHIQAIGNDESSTIADYKAMIDTTPPTRPVIKASATTIVANQVVRLTFESEDNLSGLQRNYYVQTDGGTFLPAASPLFMSLPSGIHTITVRAFDQAGNFADGSITITATKS